MPPSKTWKKWKEYSQSNDPKMAQKYQKLMEDFLSGKKTWGGVPFHIKALLYSTQNLGLDPNAILDRFYVMYVSKIPEGFPDTPYIALAPNLDFPKGFDIDTEKMVELTIRSPLEDIVELYDISWEDIQGKSREAEGENGRLDPRQKTLKIFQAPSVS
jgi:hypothetical protein